MWRVIVDEVRRGRKITRYKNNEKLLILIEKLGFKYHYLINQRFVCYKRDRENTELKIKKKTGHQPFI